jgi:hypothetical protein
VQNERGAVIITGWKSNCQTAMLGDICSILRLGSQGGGGGGGGIRSLGPKHTSACSVAGGRKGAGRTPPEGGEGGRAELVGMVLTSRP